MLTPFNIVDNVDKTYRIECLFIVQRARFGHHPEFIEVDETRGNKEGFSTKYWFLVEDDLTKTEAEKLKKEYEAKYNKLIEDIENDDARWNEFPFKDKPITYSK